MLELLNKFYYLKKLFLNVRYFSTSVPESNIIKFSVYTSTLQNFSWGMNFMQARLLCGANFGWSIYFWGEIQKWYHWKKGKIVGSIGYVEEVNGSLKNLNFSDFWRKYYGIKLLIPVFTNSYNLSDYQFFYSQLI